MKKFGLIITPAIWSKIPLLGSAYLLEYLKTNNIQTYLFDLNIKIYNKLKNNKKIKETWTRDYTNFTDNFYYNHKDIYKNLINNLKEKKIKHIGFTVYKTNFLSSVNLAKLIKKSIKDIKIIFGGPHIFYLNYYNKEYFNSIKYIDHFIIGEGEKAVLSILKKNLKDKIIFTDQIKDLSQLPFPKYNDFSLSSYDRKNSLPILLSRGCINRCSFCFEKKMYPYYTLRAPEDIINEMKYHIKKNKIKWFTFYDSMFNGNLKYMKKLLHLIIKNNLNIIWDAQTGIRKDMNNDTFKLMKDSGCINLFIGLESGDESMLSLMNKPYSADTAKKFFLKLYKNNLNYEISLIINYPKEQIMHIDKTINFIIKNKNYIKKIAQVNPYILYPGTNVDITEGYNFIVGIQRVSYLIKKLQTHNIKFTNAYINNLII